ncbi:MAG: hypothetical protein KDK76_04815 [Chlamydiia bacterium]|nr:hypothetical protein [Chlamydiia bacterium]
MAAAAGMPRDPIHIDAIYETPLIFGIEAQGVDFETKEKIEHGQRYHITTICHHIAQQFYNNRHRDDYTPIHPHLNVPIVKIHSDWGFEQIARAELGSLNIDEELPVLNAQNSDVERLKDRLVECFNQNAADSNNGYGELEMERMKAIRDQVFDEIRRGKARRNAQREEQEGPFCEGNSGLGMLAVAVVAIGFAIWSAFGGEGSNEKKKRGGPSTTSVNPSKLEGDIRYS